MRYRGYDIEQHWQAGAGKGRQPDTYGFTHPDYDGTEGDHCGCAPDLKGVHELIDELVREDLRDRLDDNVPPAIADFAVETCLRFSINGTSDQMFIANIAALEFNQGNGNGVFAVGTGNKHSDPALVLYERLIHSYSSSITDGSKFSELVDLLAKDLSCVEQH